MRQIGLDKNLYPSDKGFSENKVRRKSDIREFIKVR